MVISTYQAASGAGQAAMDELELQTSEVLQGKKEITKNIFPFQVHPLCLCLPFWACWAFPFELVGRSLLSLLGVPFLSLLGVPFSFRMILTNVGSKADGPSP